MDASGYAQGQYYLNCVNMDKWHPVGFTSKSLSDTERNYEIHDKELLSVHLRSGRMEAHLEGTQNTIGSKMTTVTSNTSRHPKIWTAGKHAGPCFWLHSTYPPSRGQDDTPAKLEPSHNGQTIQQLRLLMQENAIKPPKPHWNQQMRHW